MHLIWSRSEDFRQTRRFHGTMAAQQPPLGAGFTFKFTVYWYLVSATRNKLRLFFLYFFFGVTGCCRCGAVRPLLMKRVSDERREGRFAGKMTGWRVGIFLFCLCHPGGEMPGSFSTAWQACGLFYWVYNFLLEHTREWRFLIIARKRSLEEWRDERARDDCVKGIKKQFLFFRRIFCSLIARRFFQIKKWNTDAG